MGRYKPTSGVKLPGKKGYKKTAPAAAMPHVKDPELLQRVAARASLDKEAHRKDPWYAISKGWVLTHDEHDEANPIKPLPADEYIHAIIRLWQEADYGIIEKSRQVRMSWLFAWLKLWLAMVRDGQHVIFQGKRIDDVDAGNPHRMLGRARFIREHLPPFLRPEVKAANVTSETYANGSTLEALPEYPDVVRSRVPSAMDMDESGFYDDAEANWNAAKASAKKLWSISTPNGHEFNYRQAEPGRPWDDWRTWPELVPGVYSYRNSKGIQLVFVHYTAIPGCRTAEAQAKRKEGYTNSRDYLRENEGDFTLAEGLGVYANEFVRERHTIDKYVVDPKSPIYRGWDFGYNGQAVSFFQTNHAGQLVWFDQVILKAVPLERVIQEVKRRMVWHLKEGITAYGDLASPIVGIPGISGRLDTPVEDFGDPSAEAHNSQGITDKAVLSAHGISLVTRPTTGRKRDLVQNIRTLLLPRSDGRPALVVARNSAEMTHVIAGLAGGYHYGKAKEGKAEKEIYHKADSVCGPI
jgi:hypothetical protein